MIRLKARTLSDKQPLTFGMVDLGEVYRQGCLTTQIWVRGKTVFSVMPTESVAGLGYNHALEARERYDGKTLRDNDIDSSRLTVIEIDGKTVRIELAGCAI